QEAFPSAAAVLFGGAGAGWDRLIAALRHRRTKLAGGVLGALGLLFGLTRDVVGQTVYDVLPLPWKHTTPVVVLPPPPPPMLDWIVEPEFPCSMGSYTDHVVARLVVKTSRVHSSPGSSPRCTGTQGFTPLTRQSLSAMG